MFSQKSLGSVLFSPSSSSSSSFLPFLFFFFFQIILIISTPVYSEAIPRNDISDCNELEIGGSQLHPDLNGRYQRDTEMHEGLPTYSTVIRGETKYVWWTRFDDFSRWCIGAVKYSNSIEAFMDNPSREEAWFLGKGRNWQVVHRGSWVSDSDMYAECAKKEGKDTLQAPLHSSRLYKMSENKNVDNANKNEMTPPQLKRQGNIDIEQEQQQQQQNKETVVISGAKRNDLNGVYVRMDNSKKYPSYRHQNNPIFIYQWSYPDENRWYISPHLDSDNEVDAYLIQQTSSIAKDNQNNIWHEFWDGRWQLNYEFRVQSTSSYPTDTEEQQQQQQQQQNNEPLENRRQFDPSRKRSKMGQDWQSKQDGREQRRKDMFRRVNKLDHPIEMEGQYESNVDITGISNVVVVGSDNEEVNGYYEVMPIKYNGRYVYKSMIQAYLFYVKYKGGETARWQIGQPDSGLQNGQPIAFVNADAVTPDQLSSSISWLVYDEEKNEWFRQPKLNVYKADCGVEISGARHAEINGKYTITPHTYSNRPIFEQPDILLYLDNTRAHSRWYISQPHRDVGELSETWAFLQSASLTPDGATEFETWYEWDDEANEYLENADITLQGTCSKAKEHDWRRKRQKHEQPKKMERFKESTNRHCPSDIEISTDPGENSAIVHWATPGEGQDNQDEFDVVYDEGSLSPGSRFPIGKTAVTYSLRQGDNEIAKCDFIVHVKDTEPPIIECPGEIYIIATFNSNKGVARWVDPYVKDNSDLEIKLEQIRGPQKGSQLDVGVYEIEYKATDYFGNVAHCSFNLIVADRQAPRIHNCPADTQIEVYEDTKWSAWPEWNIPSAEDAVDSSVTIRQVAGISPGTQITIPTGAKNYVEKIVYEAADSSGNAARCSFRIELIRNEDRSGKHSEMHEKLGVQPDMADSEAQKLQEEELKHHSPEKWHEASEHLRQAQETKREHKKHAREERMRRRGGKRSNLHESKPIRDEADASEELRNNNNNNNNNNNKNKNDGKRKESRRKRKDRGGGESIFWIFISPWKWPWPVFIPLTLLCLIGCGVVGFMMVEEMNKPRGRRVPDHESWWYKITHVFSGETKTMKQRV